MVNIHHNEPMAPVADAEAIALFERQWTLYQKFIDNGYTAAAGAYEVLHRLLVDRFDRPFAFLDLACGNASGPVRALQGTQVAHYHGVDMAPPALERAARNLEALDCEIELEHGDYIEAIRDRPEPADVVWIGLSLHHFEFPGKLELMREVRQMIGATGLFAVYEPTCLDDEDRDGFLDRYEAVARKFFKAMAPDEMDAVVAHVRSSDFPETTADWERLGREAGFAACRHVFTDPHDMFRMFCYSG